MEAGSFTAPDGRRCVLKRSSGARLPDVILQWGVTLLSVAILLLIAYFFLKLIDESTTVFDRFGVFGFTFDNDWDVSKSLYGALPLVVGTLITSTIALAIGVPVAVATALYITELCPRRFRSPLTIVVELLAAVPSVVYGLWAFIVIVPFLKPAEQWFADTFSFIPFVGGPGAGRHALGDDPHRDPAVLAGGHLRSRHARPRPGDRRDDRGHDRHRQRAADRRLPLLPGLHAGGGDRQRVRRGGVQPASPLGADRGRPRALRADALREPDRPLLRPARRAWGPGNPHGCARDGRMSDPATSVLPPVSPRRRRTDKFMRGLLGGATIVAVVPLVLVIFYLLQKGLGSWSVNFFTTDPSGKFFGDPGGVKSAILGTIEMVALATLIAVPIGIGVAIYLVEYGKRGRFAQVVRYFVDVMTGVPSIVFGLFIYITLVLAGTGGTAFAGWKGSAALALLMLPIVTRAGEVVLTLVPDELREGALALGAPRWRVIFRIVLPTALPGLITGMLLAVARAAGETAPLIFTATIVKGSSLDLNGPMNSLPAQIFSDVGQAQDRLVARAWGAALTLVLMILILTTLARVVSRRS